MKESTLWLLQILTAMILLLVVPIHLILFTPLVGQGFWGGVEFTNVITRARESLWTLLYMVFVPAALFHGMYGLRVIVLELFSLEGRGLRILSQSLLVIGLLAAIYGEYTAFLTFLR